MIKYIIIFYIHTYSKSDLRMMDDFLRSFDSILEWKQDLEDCDKVLRIATTRNISHILQNGFDDIGLIAKLIAVYKGNPKDLFTPKCIYIKG